MTARRRDGDEDPLSFYGWARGQPEIDSNLGYVLTDLDALWHSYAKVTRGVKDRSVHNILALEIKTWKASVHPSQAETLHFINLLLAQCENRLPVSRKLPDLTGRVVLVRYWGLYRLRFDRTGPDDSDRIEWSGQGANGFITRDQLKLLLRFRIHPTTLKPRDERDHHGKRDQGVIDFGDDAGIMETI